MKNHKCKATLAEIFDKHLLIISKCCNHAVFLASSRFISTSILTITNTKAVIIWDTLAISSSTASDRHVQGEMCYFSASERTILEWMIQPSKPFLPVYKVTFHSPPPPSVPAKIWHGLKGVIHAVWCSTSRDLTSTTWTSPSTWLTKLIKVYILLNTIVFTSG